jgi:hypothetical protein
MELLMIRDHAFNEIHNNGLVSKGLVEYGIPFEKYEQMSTEDKMQVKTSIAKDCGHYFVDVTKPVQKSDKSLAYMVVLKCSPKLVNCVALCIQGGLEGLMISKLYEKNPDKTMDYIVVADGNVDELKEVMSQLDKMYDCYNIKVANSIEELNNILGIKNTQKPSANEKPKKKGLFSKLFNK